MSVTMETAVNEFLTTAEASTRLYRIAEIAATVGDLCELTERDLLRIKNLGKKSVRELREHLLRFGLRLKPGVVPIVDADSATSLSRVGLSSEARDWLARVGVRTLHDLGAMVRGGRSVPGMPEHLRTVPDWIWNETVRLAQEYGLVYDLGGADTATIKLVMQLSDRWESDAAEVLGDWCEERGLHAAARDLRLDPPDRRTRAAVHALACCLGVATIAISEDSMRNWRADEQSHAKAGARR